MNTRYISQGCAIFSKKSIFVTAYREIGREFLLISYPSQVEYWEERLYFYGNINDILV